MQAVRPPSSPSSLAGRPDLRPCSRAGADPASPPRRCFPGPNARTLSSSSSSGSPDPADDAGADGEDTYSHGRARRRAYKMLRFVGAGASGTVRAAVSLQTGEVVALTASRKQTPADDPGSEIAFGPWDAEIRRRYAVMAELRHPNLARIHEFFATANKFYAAMELAEGGNLESYVGRGKMLPETDIRVVLQAILDGLAYLHSHRIAHRDVKPANVLLRRQQDLSSVVPADFDGSFVSDGNETSPNMRTLVGTPFFLAPEIALGRPYGIPVDVYSAGCIAFYLACGRTPFENATSFDRLYHRISTGDWRFPKGATCRPPLRTSCGGCSRRTPQEGSQRRGHWTTRSSQRRGGG